MKIIEVQKKKKHISKKLYKPLREQLQHLFRKIDLSMY